VAAYGVTDSAYTDIATGIANLLGYRFPQNFNQPEYKTVLGAFAG
jgi:D-alanyl-lipoteichoic acid acyltransferase DltB (MBOAT superfamily)